MKKQKHKPPPKNKMHPPVPEPDEVVNRSDHARLIDKPELLRRIPVSFPTIWSWMRSGDFPKSRNIGGKSAWVESEVDAWINARPEKQFKGEDDEAVRR